MNSSVFGSVMNAYNRKFRLQGRQCVMVMDNVPTHNMPEAETVQVAGLRGLKLSNLLIVFIPPNVTSVVQPLDQGIIACLKLRYKKKLVQWVVAKCEKEADSDARLDNIVPSPFQALMWVTQVWKEMDDVNRLVQTSMRTFFTST